MDNLNGGNDEQFAAGAVVGGSASLFGPTAVGTVKAFAAKYLGVSAAAKLGIGVGVCAGPIVGVIAIAGGAGYLIYKASKKR